MIARFNLVVSSVLIVASATATAREFYQEPAWKPRAHPTVEDALGGKFHPAPPVLSRPVTYDTPGFAAGKLHPPPAPGVHPRVLVTPEDVEAIRARVAQGEAAPPEFRTMWRRVRDSRSAFYALIARDDTLGRTLAAQFVERLHSLEPKLDRLDAQPDARNLWSAERSLVASGDPDPPHELWTLLDYDYLHGWLSPDERALTERIITRIVNNRITNFLCEPDHFIINNHKGFGMEFIRMMLLIEGQPGFPAETFRASVGKARAMLDWFLSPDGMCYESIKGWLNTSAFVAVGRRDRDFFQHDHLVAKMRFSQAALRWQDGRWVIRDEMRASAFHVIWMMRYLYPENLSFDLLYHATLSSHDFLTNDQARWPDPVGVAPELLLLFAGGAPGDDRAGKLADWTSQEAIDSLKLPITWKDDLRGYVEARNSWRIGDLHLGFVNKQDFYYGGHEGSEANRITLWKDGVNWIRDEDLLAVKATGLQNMLTIDGRGLAWPPVPGVWLGVNEGKHGLSAAGDARLSYRHNKIMQVHPLAFPSGKLPYYAPFTEKNFDLTRDLQVAFHPGTVKWNDGYAHTDYGPWSGETRLVEFYGDNQPGIEQAFRTVHLARGERPYVLLMDDARHAGAAGRLFEASFNLPDDVVVVDAGTTEVQYQNVEPSGRRESEFLLARGGTPRDPETGQHVVKKGDPLLLVRVLHRNSDYGYPVPRIQILPGRPEQPFTRFSQLVIPAISNSPEFRILFYPHRSGDPLPVTAWNPDRTRLSVTIGDQHDFYQFARTDGGRTVFDFTRDGKPALPNTAAPARPVLIVRGDRFDANELRSTRRDGVPPLYPIPESGMTVAFERVRAPAEIHYTLDGSEPCATSPRFDAPFVIDKSATLRARVIDSAWPGNNQSSAELVARFDVRSPVQGTDQAPAGSSPGLLARVYEISTKLWDDHGFFRANKVMLPDLDRYQPLVTAAAREGFDLPHSVPAAPIAEQTKGFYRFTGFFHAEKTGVHDFAVDSCGPVLLVVAGQDAISETGVFHQQQAVRRGSVVLGPGWHPIELTVTDPQFWSLATRGIMPFNVSERGPEDIIYKPIPIARLTAIIPTSASSAHPEPVWKSASAIAAGSLVPGVIRSAYDRDGRSREPDYLDIDGLKPRRRDLMDRMEGNAQPDQVLVYQGWFEAPVDGIYQFNLPYQRAGYAHLGSFRYAYQSQLRVSDEIVLQRGVAGRLPDGRIGLKAGWHSVSLRLGSSPAELTVTYPDGQTIPLDAAKLRRPADASLPPNPPDADLLANIDFAKWDGKPGITSLDSRCRVWIADFARAAEINGRRALVATPVVSGSGPGGVDINLTRAVARVPLKLHYLKMRDSRFTIGMWFRSDTGNGQLFGKGGLTAFGKSYKTVSCGVIDGKLIATPGGLAGGIVKTGEWHHAALSASPERFALYLDGKLVDEGPGESDLATDALDFLTEHPGAIGGVVIQNRELSAEEIARLHASGKAGH